MHKYLKKIPLYIIYSILFGLFITNFVSATENVDYNVSVASSLTLTIPTSSIVLNLDPSSKTFDSKNLTVSVGTNNKTGYTLTLSTPSNNTDLNRDSSSDSIVATMPTLSAGTYTQTTFTEDKWGYSINSNTAIPSTVTSGYVPFVSGNTLMERSTAVNHDETELSLAAKIDYLQPAGSYSTELNFNIVANPPVDYIQDFTIDMCRTLASSADYTVVDKRDNNDYTVRYINGNCWMTRNLAIGCNGSGSTYGNTITPIELTPANTNITSNWTTPTDSLTLGLTLGDSYDDPRMECSSNYGAWYNYAAASAGTITGSSNSTDATSDICPAGWHLPNHSEMQSIATEATAFNADSSGGMYQGGQQIGSGMVMYWSSDAYNANLRRTLDYRTGVNINPNNAGSRYYGEYTRCIAN